MIKLNIKMIHEVDGNWYLSGSSEVFPNRIEAIRRVKQLNNKKKDNGRKFVSQQLRMTFRSSWEVELAELMDDLGIKFKYETKRFYFSVEHESYLPDFFLPEYNVWIEVKGYMDKKSLRRCKLFKKYYGAEYGFFLYEKEERELILKNPALLFTYIEIAQEQQIREQREKQILH
jgi:hypothetical protein